MEKTITIKILVTILVGFIVQTSRAQQIVLPNTKAGKMATAYFEAFNADDPAVMREFIANNRTKGALERISLDNRMTQHNQVKGMLKKLEPKQILASTERNLTVLAYAAQVDAWFEIDFKLNEQDPPLLEGFGLKPGAAPSKNSTEEAYGEWENLSVLLEKLVDKHGIPGVSMAVIKNGEITETAVAGKRQMGRPDAVQITDRFHHGSITKSMTATLIGKLVEEGKLRFDTQLGAIFPTMEMKPAYRSVTIRQLLDHVSGLPGYLEVTEEEEAKLLALPGDATKQRLAFAQMVLSQAPINEPGSAFAYSNAGYSILGTISEKLSGKSWEKQLEQVIFKPLGMKTAGIGWPKTDRNKDQPSGHFSEGADYRVQLVDEYPLGAYIDPAGDVHASLEDLAKFGQAHLKGLNGQDGILKASTIQQLHTPLEGGVYGGGWFVASNSGERVHEHSGSAGTFMSLIQLMPDTNEVYVIAANAGGIVLDGAFRQVIELYRARQ